MRPETETPALAPGLTLLRRPARSTALHRLVVAELDRGEGTAYWIGTGSEASTYVLYDLARHERSLDALRIARAFTAYQHYALVERVARRASGDTALVVVPSLPRLYADADVPDAQGERLLDAACSHLETLATTHDLPVLVTAESAPDEIEARASRTIEATETREGIRYDGAGFSTLTYRCGPYWQTTVPYWVDLLGAAESLSVGDAFPSDPRSVGRFGDAVDARIGEAPMPLGEVP